MSDEFEIGFDELEELYDEAEQLLEQATSFANIGKFHSFTTAHTWSEAEGMQEVGVKDWKAHQGLKFLNLHVCIDTQEFNPALERGYERRVQVKSAPWNKKLEDGTYERIPSDWFAIWEPSIKSVFGDYVNMTQALKELEGKYVKCLDVLQQPTKRQPEPEYNTAKLVQIYESRAVALQDYKAITGKDVMETSGGDDVPDGYTDWGEFETTVVTLRADDMSNKEIADALSVAIKYVVKVK